MLKKLTILIIFVFSFIANKAQVNDNFSDGDFTVSPVWTASISTDFKDTLAMLRSNNIVASSTYYISTPNALANNCQWEFFVNLKFSTSSANYVDVYLTADNANLSSATLNGYFVRIGNTTDEISLYKNVSGTITEIIDGLDAVVASSSNNLIKIKVVRNAANQFTLNRDMTGTGTSYTTEGIITDATFTTSAFFGFFIRQSTASFFKKHFFDDVYVGAIILDSSPPTLISATPLSSTTLDVLFNEPLDVPSAQTLINYNVIPSIGNPSIALIDGGNPALMHLTFASPFVNLVPYDIVVNNVSDLALNPINNDTLSFVYFISDTAAFRDVQINELMADENPQVALPVSEFIEIYNNSSKNFDLAGWTITDGSTTGTLGSQIISPGNYVIICPTAQVASFTPYGTTVGVSLPSLNNTGDVLTLKNNFGTTIDVVNYSDSWYNDIVKDDGGWTLEQINPNAGCVNATNWNASNNVSGGTPGIVNSIFSGTLDIIPPQITGYIVNSNTQLTLNFSEAIDTSSTAGIIFSVNLGITVSSFNVVIPALNQIIVNLSPPIDTGILYTITATNVLDCAGNGLGLADSTSFILLFEASFRDIVINEFLADETPQVGLPAAEFIELYNRSTNSYDVSNWTLSDASSTATLSSKILGPGQYLILCPNADTSNYSSYGITLGVTSFPSLNNTGDDIILKNGSGTIIDAISYTDAWYVDPAKNDGGYSIEQINPDASCINASNWSASNDFAGGTPGTVNSIYNNTPDTTPPQIIGYTLNSNTQITLIFSESLDSSNVSGFLFAVSGGITILNFTVDTNGLTQIIINFTSPIDTGVVYTLTATNILDCEGNGTGVSGSVNFILPFQAISNEIIINEVLFHPTTGVSDFVEIYNNSSKVINLKDWVFANIEADTIDNNKIISTVDLLIYPGQYYAFTTNKPALETYYLQAMTNRILDIPSMPALDVDSSTIILINNQNKISDRFSYIEDEMQFALLQSYTGVSLERLDFNRATSDAGNWHSAAEQVGFATPGYQNSQFNPNNAGDEELSLSVDIFSPDNDGYQDIINFNYLFTEPGYVANASLYDVRGREIKKLIRNELLATSGVFTWDGITDKIEKAPVGIYIIYFEYFNLTGTVKKIKKSFVLATKF